MKDISDKFYVCRMGILRETFKDVTLGDVLTGSSSFSAEGSLFADLGRHEIFQPIKSYNPMTVSELASSGNT